MAQVQAVIDINPTGVFLCAREAAERMIKFGKGGVIVDISKEGVASMSVVWSKVLAGYGIRVECIAPGFAHTDNLTSMKPEVIERAPAKLSAVAAPMRNVY